MEKSLLLSTFLLFLVAISTIANAADKPKASDPLDLHSTAKSALRLPLLNNPLDEFEISARMEAQGYTMAFWCDLALEGTTDKVVAWDPEMDASELVLKSLEALSVWMTDPNLYNQLSSTLKDKVNGLNKFYQAKTAVSLFNASHLQGLLLRQLGARHVMRFNLDPSRQELIDSVASISSDLLAAAKDYVTSPEVFFAKKTEPKSED